jgi:hypothetical protein
VTPQIGAKNQEKQLVRQKPYLGHKHTKPKDAPPLSFGHSKKKNNRRNRSRCWEEWVLLFGEKQLFSGKSMIK